MPHETSTTSTHGPTAELAPPRPQPQLQPLPPPTARLLVIGAGSRGQGFAKHVFYETRARVTAVADPIASKRRALGARYIWPDGVRGVDQEFASWQTWVAYETARRQQAAAGEAVPPGVDGVFICTLDHTHCAIVEALAPFGLHLMCEKPLATTLADCLRMRRALLPPAGEAAAALFSVGHVMRYSPHNMLLRKLVVEDGAVGDVLSVEHTEPVGYWHFAHSYVRGNWRNAAATAPSLLTKSCHDVDWLLWMLATPRDAAQPPHLPASVASTGRLTYFRKARKPAAAGAATNCLQCPIERQCAYSAKRIYVEQFLRAGDAGWPVMIVNPDIEECLATQGAEAAEQRLLSSLREDYGADTPAAAVAQRPWFGRCVWEADNDVCDDQTVTITWDDEPGRGLGAKNATLHMVAWTRAQCERRGRIYGTKGEVAYDSFTITVDDFETGRQQAYSASEWQAAGHGGGDAGLTRQFVQAIESVQAGMPVAEAQTRHIGCTLEDAFRSHAMVFAAEEARRQGRTVAWEEWWRTQVTAAADNAAGGA